MLTEQHKQDWWWSFFIFVCGVLFLPVIYCRGESVKLEVTGYCVCKKCCGPNAKGITASGMRAKPYVTVAAPRSWAYGTKLSVPGWGNGVVQDRGGMIRAKGKKLERGRVAEYDRVDLCFPDHASALRWGRKVITCEVTHASSPQKESSSLRSSRHTQPNQRSRGSR